MTYKERVLIRNMRRHLRQHCRQLVSVDPSHLRHNPEVRDEYQRALAYVLDGGRRMIDEWARYAMSKRSNLEPLFSLPPVRRVKRKTTKPQTLVERRATAAAEKVKAWRRKARLAATKVKQYQRKHAYYKRKGVV